MVGDCAAAGAISAVASPAGNPSGYLTIELISSVVNESFNVAGISKITDLPVNFAVSIRFDCHEVEGFAFAFRFP